MNYSYKYLIKNFQNVLRTSFSDNEISSKLEIHKCKHKSIDLVLINEEGANLFNSETNNSINFEEVRNLYLIDGEYVNQYHGNLDWPKLCRINNSETPLGNIFRISLSEHVNESNQSTTVIDWGNGDSDTIIAIMDPYTKLPYSTFWYNGVSMNDLTEKTFGFSNHYFEIPKEY